MRTFVLLLLSWSLVLGCQNNSGTSAEAAAVDGELSGEYELEAIPGSQASLAKLTSPEGVLLEMGPIRNGMKNGTWTYFAPNSDFPVKVISFVDDMYNGSYMEFNERGQAELMATYVNNKLDGPWGKYRFGRPELTANYQNGDLEGIMREYDFRNGKIKKEATYKAGQLDGLVRDYDEEGQVMVEYMYRNGEKISGGVVERE